MLHAVDKPAFLIAEMDFNGHPVNSIIFRSESTLPQIGHHQYRVNECLKKFIVDKYGGIDVLINNAGMAYSDSSTVPTIEQATVLINTNFTGTLNMMRAFLPIVKPHGRIVNLSSMVSHLARLSSQSLRDQFSSPALTEAELVALMESYITDVKEGKNAEKGWASTHYSVSKIATTAMTKVFAREMAASGIHCCSENCT